MASHKLPPMDSTGIGRVAKGWGKVVARRVHEGVGPQLDLDADEIEQIAKDAACAVAKGTIEELLEKKTATLGPEQPCPQCQRLCAVERAPRTIQFWGGGVQYREPKCHCPACRRDFFPQRPALRLTPHNCSPSVLGKAVRASARETSFQEAADALEDLAEVTISPRQLTRIAQEVGHQLESCRDQQVQQFQHQQLVATVATRPALAVVEVDGGRLSRSAARETAPVPMDPRGGKTRSPCWQPPRERPSMPILSPICLPVSAIRSTWRNWPGRSVE